MSNSSLVTYKYLVSNKSNGRGGKKIEKIFVHHMAGALTVKQCGNVFKTRAASAHYGVNGSQIGQYVDEANTAWHCGNFNWNQRSIGIELANDGGAKTNWHVADSTIETAIKLIADICKRNGISELVYTGDMSGNLCMHKWVASTSCPGAYLSKQFKRIAEGVNKLLNYDPQKAAELEAIIKKSQKFFGTTQDGTISGQLYEFNANFPALIYAIDSWDGKGSVLIKAVQKWLGVEADGLLGPATVEAWQKKIGVTADKKFGSKSLAAWSAYLDEQMKEPEPEPEPKTETLYRVRKSWDDAKSQVGAYKSLENAKKAADQHGLNVYDENGVCVYQGKKKELSAAEKIVAKAREFAWPLGTASSKYEYKEKGGGTALDAYKTALKQYMKKSAKISQTDCGYFVNTCVRAAGIDPDFDDLPNKYTQAWPKLSSKFKIAHKGELTKAVLEKLQPGDIIRYKKKSSQHTLIYLGNDQIAHASRSNAFPRITKAKPWTASNVKKDTIQVLRAK